MHRRFDPLLVFAALASLIIITSCSLDNPLGIPNWPVKTPAIPADVYVGGFYTDNSGVGHACYWKNGVMTELAAGNSAVNAITVDAGTVYTAGFTGNPAPRACYWVNAVKYDIETAFDSTPEYIRVNGVDVYVLGDCNPGGTYVTRLWHTQNNGVPVTTDFGVTGSSYFLDGTDAYVAGAYITDQLPFYSKNGGPLQYCSGSGIYYNVSLFVSGTDVYTAGYSYDGWPQEPFFWKNGNRTDLPDRGAITGVTAAGSGVYVIGTRKDTYSPTVVGKDFAMLWHNTDVFVLPAKNGIPHALQVVGNDVYAAGEASNNWKQTACCWVNGSVTMLPYPGDRTSIATSICIVPK